MNLQENFTINANLIKLNKEDSKATFSQQNKSNKS